MSSNSFLPARYNTTVVTRSRPMRTLALLALLATTALAQPGDPAQSDMLQDSIRLRYLGQAIYIWAQAHDGELPPDDDDHHPGRSGSFP